MTWLAVRGHALQARAGPQRVEVERRAPVFIRLNVKATSAAVKGCAVAPLHAVADREGDRLLVRLTRCSRWPASGSRPRCSAGRRRPAARRRSRATSELTAGLNGLNWQVQVWPCSLEMVTVPPCFQAAGPTLPPSVPEAVALAGGMAEPLVVVFVDADLLVQAAASTPSTATTVAIFMLSSSPFGSSCWSFPSRCLIGLLGHANATWLPARTARAVAPIRDASYGKSARTSWGGNGIAASSAARSALGGAAMNAPCRRRPRSARGRSRCPGSPGAARAR